MLNSVARLGIEPVLIGKRKARAYVPGSTEIRATTEATDNGSLKEFVYLKPMAGNPEGTIFNIARAILRVFGLLVRLTGWDCAKLLAQANLPNGQNGKSEAARWIKNESAIPYSSLAPDALITAAHFGISDLI
jgi:hypothetical protein